MGYWTHYCVGHQNEEDAAAWYSRSSKGKGKEYICGNKFNELSADEKLTWEQDHE